MHLPVQGRAVETSESPVMRHIFALKTWTAYLKCMQNLSRAHIPKVRYMVGGDSDNGLSMRSHAASDQLLLMLKHC